METPHTSLSLANAWDITARSIHDLLTGEYPRGLAAAERTYTLKHAMEHLKTFLEPQLGAMTLAEAEAQKAAAGKAGCKDCEPDRAE